MCGTVNQHRTSALALPEGGARRESEYKGKVEVSLPSLVFLSNSANHPALHGYHHRRHLALSGSNGPVQPILHPIHDQRDTTPRRQELPRDLLWHLQANPNQTHVLSTQKIRIRTYCFLLSGPLGVKDNLYRTRQWSSHQRMAGDDTRSQLMPKKATTISNMIRLSMIGARR